MKLGGSDVVVIGGGVIGLGIAWHCAQRGLQVTLLERGQLGAGASRAAAGMLAPVSEVDYGAAGQHLLELGMASARMWPQFAAELAEASDSDSQLRADGALMLARDRDEAEQLERALAFRMKLGLDVSRLRASEARALEPAIAPRLRFAVSAPSEQSVDPCWLSMALTIAARRAGALLRENAEVCELSRTHGRIDGVRLAEGPKIAAGNVVVAAGAWSGSFGDVAIRPVKGQVLRLRDREGPGMLTRTVRFEGGYIVPRGDGRYVIGATVEERGFDTAVTAGAAYTLIREASELVPGVLELELDEMTVGFRPGTPDNLPLIGRDGEHGVVWATGHYRNGILLTPITAERAAAIVESAC